MLLDLNIEILQIILDDLDTYSLAALAQASTRLNTLVQHTVSFEQPVYWMTYNDPAPFQCQPATGGSVPAFAARGANWPHDLATLREHDAAAALRVRPYDTRLAFVSAEAGRQR